MKAERTRRSFEPTTWLEFDTLEQVRGFLARKTAPCWKNPKMQINGVGTNWKRVQSELPQ